jgi:cytochrome c oxidase subunit 4
MSEHVEAPRTYYTVFACLIVLTLVTVGASFLELGRWHTPLGLTIAASKATLVALFFMHLRSSARLTWVVIGGSLVWLGVLIILTLADYLTRDWRAY